MKYTALQRSDLTRAKYQAEIAIYDPSIWVSVDESGTDQHVSKLLCYELKVDGDTIHSENPPANTAAI